MAPFLSSLTSRNLENHTLHLFLFSYIEVLKYADLDTRQQLIYHRDEDIRGGEALHFARVNETWVSPIEKAKCRR
jgi:hypothetical protein